MQGPTFISFTAQSHKRVRADLACETCHSKKVKCDLQNKRAEGQDTCSYCLAASRTCRPRKSGRRKQKQQSEGPHGNQLSLPPLDDPARSVHDHVTRESSDWTSQEHVPEGRSDIRTVVDTHDQQTFPQALNTFDHEIDSSFSLTSPGRLSNQPAVQRVTHTAGSSTFMDIYELENENDALSQHLALQERKASTNVPLSSDPSLELLQSFQETYYEHCYAFCPILDKHSLPEELSQSRLLCNALALAGSHIKPPMIPHRGPASYYSAAKQLFYFDEEPDVTLCLKALSLFYWWSPKPPTAIHRDSSWWWQSVIIRHAQQVGYHREPGSDHPRYADVDLGMRRKLWWTAFARERLTALCQGRPPIIDLDDCTIKPPCREDFTDPNPSSQKKADVFIYWVKLCTILGKIANHHLQAQNISKTRSSSEFVQELVDWVQEVPETLRLNIARSLTTDFDQDVHQLYLPYLAAIIVLHVKRDTGSLPIATPPAILAASCVARILRDVLARGRARSLMAITCWYTGTSFLALLSARRHEGLSQAVDEDLDVLELAVKQLKCMWPTANIFEKGFQRLRSSANLHSAIPEVAQVLETNTQPIGSADWLELFPFVTMSTSQVALQILADRQQVIPEHLDMTMPQPMMSYFQEFFDPGDSLNFLDMQPFL